MAYIDFINTNLKNKNKIILKNSNLSIKKGEIINIVFNKNNKSSLENIILNIKNDKKNKILINNVNVTNKWFKKNLSFMFKDDVFLNNLTVLENVELSSQLNKNNINAIDLIKKIKLLKKANYLPNQLSHDERRMLSFAVAIAKMPTILLCENIAINDKFKNDIIKLIKYYSRKYKVSIIILSSYANEVGLLFKTYKIQRESLKLINGDKR